MKMTKEIWNRYNIQDETQMVLFNSVVEHSDTISYRGDDDEIGEHACCGNLSYESHRDNCWFAQAVRHLRTYGVKLPSYVMASVNNSE